MAAEPGRRVLAGERWKILRRAVLAAAGKPAVASGGLRGELAARSRASVRSFSSFQLFSVEDLEEEADGVREGVWKRYTYPPAAIDRPETEERQQKSVVSPVSTRVRILPTDTSLETMMGFNNTGNVCVWPSEEVLAHYCLQNQDQFRDKSVCEVGGGMTSLAGLILALTSCPARISLTDGNETSVGNVKHILEANKKRFGEVQVSAEVLRWDKDFLSTSYEEFDFVICADCLFFVELHECLCRVIHKLLKPNGKALLFNPRRSGTLERFVATAEGLFLVELVERFDEVVWKKHCAALVTDEMYNPDLHYPIQLILNPRSRHP